MSSTVTSSLALQTYSEIQDGTLRTNAPKRNVIRYKQNCGSDQTCASTCMHREWWPTGYRWKCSTLPSRGSCIWPCSDPSARPLNGCWQRRGRRSPSAPHRCCSLLDSVLEYKWQSIEFYATITSDRKVMGRVKFHSAYLWTISGHWQIMKSRLQTSSKHPRLHMYQPSFYSQLLRLLAERAL